MSVIVDVAAERAAWRAREQRRLAPGLLQHRAEEVLERAAPARHRRALIQAASALYSRLPLLERRRIVRRAMELAEDPARTEPKAGSAPAPAAKRRRGRPSRSAKLREPVRAIIAPLLEETPELTPIEALDAVKGAGIEITRGIFQQLWQAYLKEKGLDDPQTVMARRERSMRLQRERRKQAPPKRKRVEASKAAPAPAPKAEAPEVAAPAPQITTLPEPAPVVPPVPETGLDATPGLQLVTEGEEWRITVDVQIPRGRAYEALARIAWALDLAHEEVG